MSEPRLARIKRLTGYAEMMLRNPENPKIGGIGVQTIEFAPIVARTIQPPCSQGFGWVNKSGKKKRGFMPFCTKCGTEVPENANFCQKCGNALHTVLDGQEKKFTDLDNKTYNIVKIGNQVWMAENLDYEAKGSKCYGYDLENAKKYGRLYDWETAKKVCPKGWHLPSDAEWQTLADFVDDDKIAGKKLKAKSDWNKNGNGTDYWRFAALPGGGHFGECFVNLGYEGNWWSASDNTANYAYARRMFYNTETFYRYNLYKNNLFSVRYLQDDPLSDKAEVLPKPDVIATTVQKVSVQPPFTDLRDEKKYEIVKIGNQVWMAENLAYAAEGSKCYNNDPKKNKEYGRLYDWETAKKACPPGWHLPSDTEWQELVDFAGGYKIAGKKLKAKSGWNENGNDGTDDYGFAALPGGSGYSNGYFSGANRGGIWWSATEDNTSLAWDRAISYDIEDASKGHDDKTHFFSVRCVQD
jgi:uncharacterized protein (TIGR02145 family)